MAVQGLFTHIKQEGKRVWQWGCGLTLGVFVVHTATAVTAIGVLGVWCRLLPPRHKETLEFIEVPLLMGGNDYFDSYFILIRAHYQRRPHLLSCEWRTCSVC